MTLVGGVATLDTNAVSGFGYGTFDKNAIADGTGTTVSVGPLTPAAANEIALFAFGSASGSTPSAPAGWYLLQGTGAIFAQIQPSTSPLTATATVTSGNWGGNLLLFPYGGASLTATGTSVTVVTSPSNVCTVACDNSFVAGTQATFSGFTTATFLNGNTYTLLTATSSQVTFAISHAAYGPTGDSGTVYDVGVIQIKGGSSGSTTGQVFTFDNPVTAGSTLLVFFLASDNGTANYGFLATCTDSQGNSNGPALTATITEVDNVGTKQYHMTCNNSFSAGMPIYITGLTGGISGLNGNWGNIYQATSTDILVGIPQPGNTGGTYTGLTGTATGPTDYTILNTPSNPGYGIG